VKHPFSIFSFFVAGLWVAVLSAVLPANASVNVTQHHNHDSRDGLYIDPAFTPTNAANLARDTNFTGTITGNVYAQPLYIENGPGGRAMVIAVTESNNVYALDAANGSIIWQRNVGTAITSGLPCGNIIPLGITGTPIVDLASRSLFFDAETTPSAGTFKHLIYSLNVDTGDINAGWPVDVGAVVSGFTSSVQSERGALGIAGGILYVPYGGRFGDCGSYRGRLVGVQMNNPAGVMAWATTATGGGVWGPGGVASEGTNPFVVTGNTFGTGGTWGGGEAVIRFQPGPIFSGSTTDYWAPTNWFTLDQGDTDLGGSGPVLVDVPGATPSQLVVALGKDGNAYLLNRSNLGGVSAPVASLHVSGSSIIQAAATYRTNQGTYVAFRASTSTLAAFHINAGNPPTITTAWSVSQIGRGSPFVTSTDGTNNMIVWVVGSEGDQRLHGYDGDTGAVVYAGGGVNELMIGTRKFNTGIVARGRIYIANDNKVYAFTVPVPALQLTSAVSRKTHGAAGTFDIPLPLSGSPGVECRTGGATGDYTQVFTFTNNVTSGNASVTGGIGSVSGMPVFSGNTMTVNLTGVANAQTLTVTLSGVTDEFSQVLPDTPVSVDMLIGDTNGNGVVNATDVAQTKAQVGQPVTSSNFRTDVNASGIINATDVAIVKAHSGGSISAPHARARSSAAIATGH
jgi:outer membrane protein assembly factor BamB